MRPTTPIWCCPSPWAAQGWWNRPFETQEQRPERARRLLADLLDRHGDSDDHVALVSHGGFYNYLLWAILGMEATWDRWFTLNNCAITHIAFDDDEVRVHYTNRLDFMPRELVT